jgi:hypothetical protein
MKINNNGLWNSIDDQQHSSRTQQQHKEAQLRSKQINTQIKSECKNELINIEEEKK